MSLLTCNQNWYGEDAQLLQNESDYTVVEIKCEGTGIITDYRVFPGINLIFMDFNCTDVFREPRQAHDFIDIRHYQEGRVEFEFENRRIVHMQQDEFCINSMSTVPAMEAAKAAQCHAFIEALPDGYDTVIGSAGVRLSGGERQRIAIARAIVKDAPIIVLDEATAFSDPENEALIQKAFETLIQNKTVIMIAHRLSTIRKANQILVMKNGRLVERGTHDTLLRQGGDYARMWANYTESMRWKISKGKAV